MLLDGDEDGTLDVSEVRSEVVEERLEDSIVELSTVEDAVGVEVYGTKETGGAVHSLTAPETSSGKLDTKVPQSDMMVPSGSVRVVFKPPMDPILVYTNLTG